MTDREFELMLHTKYGATHVCPFEGLAYKQVEDKMNDGTVQKRWCYLTAQSMWFTSAINGSTEGISRLRPINPDVEGDQHA